MEYGDLYIIPNEDLMLQSCFHKKVISNHLDGIKEFVKQNQLGYNFKNQDYQNAPCILAADGHLVIKTVDNAGNLIFYLPEYVTDNQNMWVFENAELFKKYSMVGGYQVKQVGDSYETKEIYGLSDVMRRLNYNNVLYHQNNRGIKR